MLFTERDVAHALGLLVAPFDHRLHANLRAIQGILGQYTIGSMPTCVRYKGYWVNISSAPCQPACDTRDTGSIYLTHTKHRAHGLSQGMRHQPACVTGDTRPIYLTHTNHRAQGSNQCMRHQPRGSRSACCCAAATPAVWPRGVLVL